jgi:hypothetical protein
MRRSLLSSPIVRAALGALSVMTVAGASASPAGAQATACPECVKIGLRYDPNARPGVLVLPVGGESGDSVRAILQRDLDYGDRVTVLPAGAEAAQSGTRFN